MLVLIQSIAVVARLVRTQLEDSRAALKALSRSPPKRRFVLAKFSFKQIEVPSFGSVTGIFVAWKSPVKPFRAAL